MSNVAGSKVLCYLLVSAAQVVFPGSLVTVSESWDVSVAKTNLQLQKRWKFAYFQTIREWDCNLFAIVVL